MRILKIALLQMVSSPRNLNANLRKGENFCRRAASGGAHIALFPEMWSIGYDGFDPDKPGDREAWLALAVTRDEPFVQHFRQVAAEHGAGYKPFERTAFEVARLAPAAVPPLLDGNVIRTRAQRRTRE